MDWHGFGMYGMGGAATDPGEAQFSYRVATEVGVHIHGSPYRDTDAGRIAAIIQGLPPEDGLFIWGTSLGANNVPVICTYIGDRIVDGAFGFQASIFGARNYPLNKNVLFAHLFYSYNPIPAPGLGAYIWPVGTMNRASFHPEGHHIPHPGDYDVGDQNKFLAEMKRIIKATKR